VACSFSASGTHHPKLPAPEEPMPAVGWIAKIDLSNKTFNDISANLSAVDGLLIGERAGSELALATWADTPEQVEAQAQIVLSVDGVVGCDLAFVDWNGEEVPASNAQLWQRKRRANRDDSWTEG